MVARMAPALQSPAVAGLAGVVRRIAELGSVARAARVLGITTQAASVAWRSLEQHAGTRLLVREGSVLRVTPAGAQFLAAVAPEPTASLARERAALHLDICPSELRAIVLASLPCFTAPRPDVRLHIRSSDSALSPWPGTLAAAVRVGARWLDRPDATLIATYPRVACAARSSVATAAAPVDAPDFPDAPDASLPALLLDLDEREDAVQPDELVDADATGPRTLTLASNDVDLRLAATLAGRAVAVLPLNPAVRNHLARGSLVRVMTSTRFEGLPVVMLRASSTPPGFDEFADWLQSLYRSECLHADELLQRSSASGERR